MSKDICVLGIDPGGTTGMTVVAVEDGIAVVTASQQIDCSTEQGSSAARSSTRSPSSGSTSRAAPPRCRASTKPST